MQATRTETEAPLDQQIEQARARLATLNEAAVAAEAEAQRWQTSFEREPTMESDARARVSAQKAKNARATADTFECETLAPLLKRDYLQRQEAQRAEIAPVFANESHDAIQRRIETIIRDCVKALNGEVAALAALLMERDRRSSDAAALGIAYNAVSLETLVSQVRERLMVGLYEPAGDRHCALICATPGRHTVVRLDCMFPIQVPFHIAVGR